MSGTYSAKVELTNEERQYDDSLMFTTLSLLADITVPTSYDVSLVACFSGTINPIKGIITSVEENEDLEQKTVSLDVKSYFFRLGKKVINTEHFVLGAKDAIELVVTDYFAITPGLWSFTGTNNNNRVFGPVSGNNAADELRQLAQAGESALFVGEDGILKTTAWKDHNSPVDVVIPPEAVISATRSKQDDPGPSRIRMRGGYFSSYQRGLVPSIVWPNPCAKGKVPITWCILSGIPITFYDAPIFTNNVGDSVHNGKFVITGPGTSSSGNITIIDGVNSSSGQNPNHRPEMTIEGAGAGSFIGASPVQVTIEASAYKRDKRESENPNTQLKALKANQAHIVRRGTVVAGAFLGQAPNSYGGPASGGGIRGSAYNLNNDRDSDEAETTQFEIEVADPGLQSQYGVVVEQMENKYVKDKNLLFKIAVRRFQEIRMARNSWDVAISPLPCLQLGQKVQFRTPSTQAGSYKEVTGLLTQMSLDYNADNATMSQKIVVQSMEDIGTTTYVSQDLTSDNSFSSVDSNDWWSASVPSGSHVGAGNGAFYISAVGGDPAITLVEHNFQSGGTFDVSFDATKLSGSGDISFDILDSALNVLLPTQSISGTGSYSYSFNSTLNPTVAMIWTMSAPSEWLLENLVITQTMVG